MLNVGKIEEGFVLDHIAAGKSLSIYEHLQLDKLDCTVAIIILTITLPSMSLKAGKSWKRRIWCFPNKSRTLSAATIPDASLP